MKSKPASAKDVLPPAPVKGGMMEIDSVNVTRPEGSYYAVSVYGSGFGARAGLISMTNPDGGLVPHVNVLHWADDAIEAEVADGALMPGGLMPGMASVLVVPAPGVMMDFTVPDMEAAGADDLRDADAGSPASAVVANPADSSGDS